MSQNNSNSSEISEFFFPSDREASPRRSPRSHPSSKKSPDTIMLPNEARRRVKELEDVLASADARIANLLSDIEHLKTTNEILRQLSVELSIKVAEERLLCKSPEVSVQSGGGTAEPVKAHNATDIRTHTASYANLSECIDRMESGTNAFEIKDAMLDSMILLLPQLETTHALSIMSSRQLCGDVHKAFDPKMHALARLLDDMNLELEKACRVLNSLIFANIQQREPAIENVSSITCRLRDYNVQQASRGQNVAFNDSSRLDGVEESSSQDGSIEESSQDLDMVTSPPTTPSTQNEHDSYA